MWCAILMAAVLLAQNDPRLPAAAAASPSGQQTPLDEPTPPAANTPSAGNVLPAPNVPSGAPAPAPVAATKPVEDAKKSQAQLQQSVQSLEQTVQSLGEAVQSLAQSKTANDQSADTAARTAEGLSSIVETGAAIEAARDQRLADYDAQVGGINAIDQGLEQGDASQLAQIQSLQGTLAAFAQSAASNPVEAEIANATLQSVAQAGLDLAGGDFFSARTDLAWARNGLLTAIGAAGVSTNPLWR